RQLLLQAFVSVEEAVLEGAKQRRRRRYLLTRFGEIRFLRWQTRTEAGYGCPLDRALGISPKDQCSPWVRATAAWLAQAHPYRQAARLLSKMIGQSVDHRRVWDWVQGSGQQVKDRYEALRRSLFQDGEAPSYSGPSPKIVSTSADGTFIHSRAGPIEVKLGLWWTGAHLQSPTSARARWLLQGKGFYASTQDADTFGQTFYALAAERAGIAKAKDVFFVSDGAGWLGDLPSDWIAPTAVQLDHFHGKLRISEVAKDPERAARWWAWVAEHNLGALGRSINSLASQGRIDLEDGRKLLGYLARGQAAINTYVRMQEVRHSPQMAPRGSGAMEHNVDLVVARRFKRQGMRSWSREGADNLLALRVLAMDPEGWRDWWGEAAD
ncbi:MAG: UPF0236 family protein, partial [Actinomycetota bacterium]|nr:UPF0236 family protein [Actinomycetota bacterium]